MNVMKTGEGGLQPKSPSAGTTRPAHGQKPRFPVRWGMCL